LTAQQLAMDRLAVALQYAFKDAGLLQLALTHRSVDGRDNNERLEFLGDSVLNLVVGQALYERFPAAREGQLSRMRASLVCCETLAAIAAELSLGDAILLGPGEVRMGGGRRESTLSDALEAIIGAVSLDGGFDAARHLVCRLFASRLESMNAEYTVKDNKTALQEFLQGRSLSLPRYVIESVHGAAHSQTFVVLCHIDAWNQVFSGTGTSRRQAEQQAAGRALAHARQPETVTSS
jgi:ribonuclease-3